MSDANPSKSKRRLGRGLSSLMSSMPGDVAESPEHGYESEEPAAPKQAQPTRTDGQPAEIGIDQIAPNPYQPRREFKTEELEDLARSIQAQGILQPLIIVRKGDRAVEEPYILIAGERRLRAAKKAGLADVPCIIRDASTKQMLEWAIIENIQRSDLNPIERAVAYRNYVAKFKLSQADAAERLGTSRAALANHIRMLDLPDEVQALMISGDISFGHGKVLAGLAGKSEQQISLARKIARKNLSVRQTEQLVEAAVQPGGADNAGEQPSKPTKAAYIRDLEEQLTHVVGTRVQIQSGREKNKGRIVVDYYSLDDFDRIASLLGLKVDS